MSTSREVLGVNKQQGY